MLFEGQSQEVLPFLISAFEGENRSKVNYDLFRRHLRVIPPSSTTHSTVTYESFRRHFTPYR